MKKCKTCETIEFWLKEGKRHNQYCDYKLFAKISQYGWLKGKKKIKGDEQSQITTRAYNLKYCPTCGRKLETKEVEE